MNVQLSNGGRHQSAWAGKENNDCTVIALANALGVSYDKAHEFMTLAGREVGKGSSVMRGLKQAYEHGYCMYGLIKLDKAPRRYPTFPGSSTTYLRHQGPTVRQFVHLHPIGHWVLAVKGHALAVVEGAVRNSYRMNGGVIVVAAWWVRPNNVYERR